MWLYRGMVPHVQRSHKSSVTESDVERIFRAGPEGTDFSPKNSSSLCLQKAAQTLADTLESPAEGLLPRLRRALFWYAVLPQLLLRDVRGKKKLRKANEISERCGSFLEGRYSQLLQSWRTDRTKVLSKSKRSERPDTDILRLEQAIKKIQRNEPHCISKAVNLVLGHGRIGCDNPETLARANEEQTSRGSWRLAKISYACLQGRKILAPFRCFPQHC